LGLRLAFHLLPNDSLACRFSFAQHWEGYSGLVHGGILAAALDGAMTNWLLAHGHAAVTAELKVRYRHPVAVNRPAFIVARLVEISGPVYLMTAELRQAGRRAVTATAKFMLNASSAKITKAPS
jgi:acyl-coenzyme A thioesterase PaaI-like protein